MPKNLFVLVFVVYLSLSLLSFFKYRVLPVSMYLGRAPNKQTQLLKKKTNANANMNKN